MKIAGCSELTWGFQGFRLAVFGFGGFQVKGLGFRVRGLRAPVETTQRDTFLQNSAYTILNRTPQSPHNPYVSLGVLRPPNLRNSHLLGEFMNKISGL